jgi:hypothetical protein
MTSDPYKTPRSDVSSNDQLPQRPVLGIFVGCLVDIGGTIIGMIIIGVVYGIILGATGGNVEDIESLTTNYSPFSLLGIAFGVFGLAMSYIAGYICAKVSRAINLKYPMIMASIIFVLGTLVTWGGEDVFFLLLIGLAGFAVTLLGARKYIKSNDT